MIQTDRLKSFDDRRPCRSYFSRTRSDRRRSKASDDLSSLTGTIGRTRFLLVFAASPRNVLLEHQTQIARESRAIRIEGENAPTAAIGTEQPLFRDGARNAFRSHVLGARLRDPARLSSFHFELSFPGFAVDAWHVPLPHGSDIAPRCNLRYPAPYQRRSSRSGRPAFMATSPPSRRIMSAKPGKLVAMKAPSSTFTGRSRREPHHQRRHGDAMVHVGRDEAAAGEHGRGHGRSDRRRRSRPRHRSPAASAPSRRGGRIP